MFPEALYRMTVLSRKFLTILQKRLQINLPVFAKQTKSPMKNTGMTSAHSLSSAA